MSRDTLPAAILIRLATPAAEVQQNRRETHPSPGRPRGVKCDKIKHGAQCEHHSLDNLGLLSLRIFHSEHGIMDSIGFIKKYLPRTHDVNIVKWRHVAFVSGIAARLLYAKDIFNTRRNFTVGVNIGIEFRSEYC